MKLMAEVVSLVLLVGCASAFAAAPGLRAPQVRLPLLKTPPTIDGTISDDEWAAAARAVIKKRGYLIRLGLATRKVRKKAAPEPTGGGAPA